MPIRELTQLASGPKSLVEAYLREVRAAVTDADEDTVEDVSSEVLVHVLGLLDPQSDEADVRRVLAQVGPASSFSAEPAELSQDSDARAASPDDVWTKGAGTILGMPYDWRRPTAQRVARSWWNPQDERIFVPRLFGIGWSLNFGRVAVALGLIEPDAQDEPFCSTPDEAFRRGLLVPVTIAVLMLATFAVFRPSLGSTVAAHWDIAGRPDEFWPTAVSFGWLFGIALAALAWALRSEFVKASPLSRGASIGFATFVAALAGAIWALTLITELTGFVAFWLPPLVILGSLAVPFGVMLALASSGRNREIARDTGRR